MKKFLLIVPVFFLWMSLSAQQFNDANAQKRDVKGFHAIRVSQGIELHLTQGSTEAVAVSASDPEYRDKVKTEVVNGVLKIYFDDDWWNKLRGYRKHLRAYVSFVNLDNLHASSGASVKTEGAIKVPALTLDASSGATFDGKVDVNTMDVDQSSGSSVTISGTVKGTLKADGSSGSVFKGYDLTVENCEAETSSGAGIQVTVNKELSVNASSGGYIHYKGSGLIRDVHTSSGGSVTRKS